MKNAKRILALVLSFLMVFTSVPMNIAKAATATVTLNQCYDDGDFQEANQGDALQFKNGYDTVSLNPGEDVSYYKANPNGGIGDKIKGNDVNVIFSNNGNHLPSGIEKNATPGKYYIFVNKDKNNGRRTFKVEIKAVAKELRVSYAGLDQLNEKAVKNFARYTTIKDNEISRISTNINDYVNSTYEIEDTKYTLKNTSNVNVSTTENGVVVVTITADYEETAIPYYQTIEVNYDTKPYPGRPGQVKPFYYDSVIVSADKLGKKVECTKGSQIVVTDYVKELIIAGNKYYELDEDATKVEGLEFTGRERTVKITPVYKEVKMVTLKYRCGNTFLCQDEVIKASEINDNNKNTYAKTFEGYDLIEIKKDGEAYRFNYEKVVKLNIVRKLAFTLNGKTTYKDIDTQKDVVIKEENYKKLTNKNNGPKEKEEKDNIVKELAKKEGYTYNGTYELNETTLTIYYRAKQLTVNYSFNEDGVAKDSYTEIYAMKDDKDDYNNKDAKYFEKNIEIEKELTIVNLYEFKNITVNSVAGTMAEITLNYTRKKDLKVNYYFSFGNILEKIGSLDAIKGATSYVAEVIEAVKDITNSWTVAKEEAKDDCADVWEIEFDANKVDFEFVNTENETINKTVSTLVHNEEKNEWTLESIKNNYLVLNLLDGKSVKFEDLTKDIKIDEVNVYKYNEAKVEEKEGVIVVTLVFAKGYTNPVNYVHQLFYHEANGQGEYTLPIEGKSGVMAKVERCNYNDKKSVFNAYKEFALDEKEYVLDTFYLEDEAITYDMKTNTVYFNYWARVIDINYRAEGIDGKFLNEDHIRRVINFKDFEIINENTDFKPWLEENELIEDVQVGNKWYKFDSYEKELKLVQRDRKDYCYVILDVLYKYDDIANCEHKEFKYIDLDKELNIGHKVVCAHEGCSYVESQKDEHTYGENDVCTLCGHKRNVVVIEATPRSVSNFGKETIDSILEEAIKEFEGLTDEFFTEKFPEEQRGKTHLYGLELPYTQLGGERYYEAIVEDNEGITFKYVLRVQQRSKKSKKKSNTTNITDELPLAGGAIADLRNNRPNDMLTRSEFVGVLAQILPVLDGGKYKPFEDISGDANELSIKKYSTFEIVKGYCDEEFGPNDFITREQMYLILARAIKFSGKATDLTEDQIATELAKILNGEKVSEWATEGVAIAIQKGLTSDANEDPQGNIMRAQAADKLEKFVAIIATTEEEPKLD